MMANLMDNELKHLPPSSTVWLWVRSGNDIAFLTIEDDGPGFDPKVASHLFEPKVKGRESRGYGLGLAFVQAVIRTHGASVSAANRSGNGARIAIALPLLSSGSHTKTESAVLVNG